MGWTALARPPPRCCQGKLCLLGEPEAGPPRSPGSPIPRAWGPLGRPECEPSWVTVLSGSHLSQHHCQRSQSLLPASYRRSPTEHG